MGIRRFIYLPLTAMTALPAAPAIAQSVAPTREEIDRKPVTPLPPTTGQRVTVEGDVERAPCPLADMTFSGVTLTLSGAEFSNLKGIPADILRPAYEAYIGKTIPIATVCEIRDAAATILRRRGYLAAVQVPPQKIDNGVVRFDVLLAKIVDFQVRGNAGKAEGIITGYLSAIKNQEVFNILDAERYLLLARDLPGYDVRLTLRPAGTVPGEVIGEVQVVYTPVEAEANIQNYGSKNTGRFGGLAQVHFNGLLGTGDRTSLGFFSTADFEEQQVAQFGEELRVGNNGLTIAANAAYAWTHPDIGPGLNLRSRTFVASLEARYPLVRRQSRNLIVSGGLDWVDQRVRFSGLPLTKDNIRVGYVRLDYDQIDSESVASARGYSASEPLWRFGGSIELRQGLGILNNSDDCGPAQALCALPGVVPISRTAADTTAFVARAQSYLEFRPVPIFAISVSPRVQYAPHALLSYEEFSAGNFTVGRGYDPGTITGDSGIGIASEFRLGSLVPKSNKDTAIQGYAFFDTAWVWNKDPGTPNDPQKLYSVGGGVRAAIGDRFNLDVGGAVPLKRAGLQAKRGDVRFLINLTMRLLPWNRR